jgi:hypothetical protein
MRSIGKAMGKIKGKDSGSRAGMTNAAPHPSAESGLGEIVFYQPEGDVRLEVRVENDTVWLNRQQLAILFNRDIKTIGKHISNTLKEECHNSVVAKFATTAEDGKTYQVEHYDLDIILSVGYRVKSANGVRFRRWANQVLKDYMLKGYAVNQRMVATGMQIANRFQEQRQLIENQGAKLENVETRLSTVEKHNKQYPGLELKTMRTIHDRFLLVDDTVYHFGASFKDMGNEMTAFSVLNFVTPEEVIAKIQESMKGK